MKTLRYPNTLLDLIDKMGYGAFYDYVRDRYSTLSVIIKNDSKIMLDADLKKYSKDVAKKAAFYQKLTNKYEKDLVQTQDEIKRIIEQLLLGKMISYTIFYYGREAERFLRVNSVEWTSKYTLLLKGTTYENGAQVPGTYTLTIFDGNDLPNRLPSPGKHYKNKLAKLYLVGNDETIVPASAEVLAGEIPYEDPNASLVRKFPQI